MKPDPRRSFGILLRKWRKAASRTLADLAGELEVSVVYLSDVERGNRPPFKSNLLDRIAVSLNVAPVAVHRAAAEARGTFKLDATHVPPAARELVAGLARGEQYSDAFWEELVQLAEKDKERVK
jgi:transcriptional regulator with XRE-family HTH domain